MNQNRETVLGWIGLSEGGYVDHPDDPGGATNKGITQRTFDTWRDAMGVERLDVRNITQREAEDIIVDGYFDPVRFDDLPAGLDYAMADYAVNSGPRRAALDLQRTLVALGVKISVDGWIGPLTLAGLSRRPVPDIIQNLCYRRMAFLESLRHAPSFITGWRRRVMGESQGAQDWDSGVIDRGVRMAKGNMVTSAPQPAPGKGVATPGLLKWIFQALERLLT